ncbi:hypothetical protein OXYTRIMIC_228 [Oxytricha trifallax]|uniref:Uncharacterized protein n=1 Tax=Oxytricha trifallax TaxID=1172189 RepID=A0A073I057_9SPIT|nr:hypothetical protein OXYTRIMIC_228 [Oxytricha trifallax]
MEENKSKSHQHKHHQNQYGNSRNQRYQEWQNKAEFWQKVKEVRFMHRDRSKDQEVLGIRENKHSEVPLNKQMGFKSRLKIGQSNPSKRLYGTQPQRTQFDVHMDGSPCIQADQMKVKLLIDLAEVTCQGFDKIILAKKGWSTMTTRMVTIVCCPSTRSLMEKALVQRFTDKENARRQGAREWELWTEKQQEHWREINEEWQYEDILPGGHIKETTMEVCLKQIEEAQIRRKNLTPNSTTYCHG